MSTEHEIENMKIDIHLIMKLAPSDDPFIFMTKDTVKNEGITKGFFSDDDAMNFVKLILHERPKLNEFVTIREIV